MRKVVIISAVMLLAAAAAQAGKKKPFPAAYESLKADFVSLMKKYPKAASKRFALWDLGDNFDLNAQPKAGEAPWYECEESDGVVLCEHPDRPQ